MTHPLPCPQRRRQIPSQFSWVDQRLARHNYFERAPSDAWALYLFLITVADAQGVSYYSERTLCRRFRWHRERLASARQTLVQLDVLAYQSPLYQVLALTDRPAQAKCVRPRAFTGPTQARQHLQHLRQQLRGRS